MNCIPVSLSLEEICAAAMVEAAQRLESDTNADSFVAALHHNQLLWRMVIMAARHNDWDIGDQRSQDFVMNTLRKCGCGVVDSDIEGLITINLCVASRLLNGRPFKRVHQRAQLAWHQADRPGTLDEWLIQQIEHKTLRRLAVSQQTIRAMPPVSGVARPAAERRN